MNHRPCPATAVFSAFQLSKFPRPIYASKAKNHLENQYLACNPHRRNRPLDIGKPGTKNKFCSFRKFGDSLIECKNQKRVSIVVPPSVDL